MSIEVKYLLQLAQTCSTCKLIGTEISYILMYIPRWYLPGTSWTRLVDSGSPFVDVINSGLWNIDDIANILKGVSLIRTETQSLVTTSWWPFMSFWHSVIMIAGRRRVSSLGHGELEFVWWRSPSGFQNRPNIFARALYVSALCWEEFTTVTQTLFETCRGKLWQKYADMAPEVQAASQAERQHSRASLVVCLT